MALQDEQEHEVYGGDIPEEDEGEMETDEYQEHAGEEGAAAAEDEEELEPGSASRDLEDMKKRLKEIEEEASALREMQAKAENDMAAAQDPSSAISAAEKEEVDLLNRVTILTDKFGQPKGFAYVEFVEEEAVQNSLVLNESELHGRQIKVSAKRTNVPGMRQFRGRRPFRPMRGFMPGPPFYPPYAYGRVPRFRRPMRYRPY
ncbi:hypothetical protein F2Q69_00019894 [Brassica cretica]|uniref:RRM domain-containing protein n=1 Tax=Brassica cretica TaxID=69181 RepID=A0A8S9QMJ0_BRACR|nr:hypothetical protein F2Q69_00019894 [Brassica cretica]